MCDIVTIAGLAASGGAVLANQSAQNSVSGARNEVMSAERGRQGALDREADAVNLKSRERYTDFGGKQDAKATELGDYFAPGTGTTTSLPTSSSNIVTREVAKRGGEAKAFGEQQGDALGKLRAFGDVLGENSRGQARDATTIGQIGGFKKGSAGVSAYELEEANHAGNDMKLLGDILGGAGKVGITAGLSGGSGKIASMFGGMPAATPATVAAASRAATPAPWGPTYNTPIPAAYLRF